ncbi:nucleotidyl transferase AbiEii/AbiGii toxin family protein [Anaerovibrio sp.]|uniref:nucleotidyl transferase AbiEii/AbiGii toxin family protein n=1 Tax=Anaerovibrio sp. TaxID=1872532 RepID=UPI00388D591C
MKTKNAMQLKALIRNKAKEWGISPQLVLQNYMLERLLERMSKSKYANNFIIKGGFLLSSIVGLSSRATMDLDTTIKGFTLTKEALNEIITEICQIKIDDDITFELLRIDDIRQTDDYPGLRAYLDANYAPMKVPLTIDVTTGDVITPNEVEFYFASMFDDTKILMLAYTLETVLAEKIETILSRGIANTRPRDYYDVYILYKTKSADIDPVLLKEALNGTLKKRNSENALNDYKIILDNLAGSQELQRIWKKYRKSYSYAFNIEYQDTCDAVRDLIERANM